MGTRSATEEATLSFDGETLPLAGDQEDDPMKRTWKYLAAGAILSAVLLAGIASAVVGSLTVEKNGDIVTIAGTTNLATGDRLIVSIISAGFTPTEKGTGGGFAGAQGTVVVQPGSPLNIYTFDVNVSTFPPGEYLVSVESVETGFRASTQFTLPWTPVTTETSSTPTPPSTTTVPAPAQSTPPGAQASPTQTPLPEILSLAAFTLATWILLRRG
jgi:hypothetical protein